MKIVILDDVTITPAQEERLRRHGEVVIFTGVPTRSEEILTRAEGAQVLVASWTKINAQTLESLPHLQLISIWATGYDNVDVEAAMLLGIRIAHVPGYATEAVAELCFGLMLAVVRRILPADRDVRHEKQLNWNRFQGMELKGKVLGLLGTGAIGYRAENRYLLRERHSICPGESREHRQRSPAPAAINRMGAYPSGTAAFLRT